MRRITHHSTSTAVEITFLREDSSACGLGMTDLGDGIGIDDKGYVTRQSGTWDCIAVAAGLSLRRDESADRASYWSNRMIVTPMHGLKPVATSGSE